MSFCWRCGSLIDYTSELVYVCSNCQDVLDRTGSVDEDLVEKQDEANNTRD